MSVDDKLCAVLIKNIPEPIRRAFRVACVAAGTDMQTVLREYMRRVGSGEEKLDEEGSVW